MSLSRTDIHNILRHYDLMKESRNMTMVQKRKIVNEVLHGKFCRCIKKVKGKSDKEGRAIAICTNSIFVKQNLKRGKFSCKEPLLKISRKGRVPTRCEPYKKLNDKTKRCVTKRPSRVTKGTCKKGWIINPYSGRCIKRDGPTAKKYRLGDFV